MTEKAPEFNIGKVPIHGNLILAPMDGITDQPLRGICRKLGSAMSVTEFINALDVLTDHPRYHHRLAFEPFHRPLSLQMLGDEADQISDLKRMQIEGQNNLTVLATDSEYGQKIVTSEVLNCYQDWTKDYKGEDHFPILFLGKNSLQFKVKKALTKAAEADVFVNFCLRVATFVKRNIS